MADCITCHKPNPEHARFCQFCGAPQAAAQPVTPSLEPEIACPGCGRGNLSRRKFCAHCGCNLQTDTSPAISESESNIPVGAKIETDTQATVVSRSILPAVDMPAPESAEAEALVEPKPDVALQPVIVSEPATVAMETPVPVTIQPEPEPEPASSPVLSEPDSSLSASSAMSAAENASGRRWFYLVIAVLGGIAVAVGGALLSTKILSAPEVKSRSANSGQKLPAVLAPGLHIEERKEASALPVPVPAVHPVASNPVVLVPTPALRKAPLRVEETEPVKKKPVRPAEDEPDTPPAAVHKNKARAPSEEHAGSQLEKIRRQKELLKRQIESE